MSQRSINQPQPFKVVFIAAHDAYLKGALNIYTLLEKQNSIQASWFTTSKRLEARGVRRLAIGQAMQHDKLQQADLIVAGLGGRDLNRLIHSLKRPDAAVCEDGLRPRIIGYFPGVLHQRIFESLASRLCCDQVLLNCERDYRLYRQLALATTGEDNGRLLGAPWISSPPRHDQPKDIDLLFVEQSVVPETLNDRTQLVKCLSMLARQHPNWRIVVALRARKDQTSSHPLEYCLEEISQQLLADGTLEFVLGDIDQLLGRARRVATISSSVAYTSLAWGKPTLFISDLGIKQSWGNDLFQRSGYMARLQEVGDLSFKVNDWYQQFIQLPRPDVIGSLASATSSTPKSAIPRIHIINLRLLWVVLIFCIKNIKNPLVELRGVIRTVRNINKRIYKL